MRARMFATVSIKTGAVAALMLFLASAASAQTPNDDFDNATVVAALPFSDNIDTSQNTTAPDDPADTGFYNGPTTWYSYTPAADGSIQANTFGSNYDTTLAAFTGTRGNLSLVALNDDSGGLQSLVRVDVTAGTTYYTVRGIDLRIASGSSRS